MKRKSIQKKIAIKENVWYTDYSQQSGGNTMANIVPYMHFFGDQQARDMGIVFAENLADLLAKVEDGSGEYPRGFIHTSTVPHEGTCYYDQIWARDAGRGVQELARLGFVQQAMWVVDYFLSHKNFGDHWGRLIDRQVKEDNELDGNTHILNAIAQTWRSCGKQVEQGIRYITECQSVFRWMERCMDACPLGDLIPCQSELAGNPVEDDPVYAIYPNYGAAIALKNFVEMAVACQLQDTADWLQGLLERLTNSIVKRLVSLGDNTQIPAGVWLNALTREGESYEIANFFAHFPIVHWTRQLPFVQNYDAGTDAIQEDALAPVHWASYEYIRHHMAKGAYFRKYGFVSNTCWSGAGGRHDDTMCGYGQNYFTQASLLADDVNTYGKCLEGIARLAYDGDVIEPLSFEMNPYVLHECFCYENYENGFDHTFGTYEESEKNIADNPGDEGNLVQASETLKTLSLVAGISVQNGVLVVKPRLPWRWEGMELTDYPVTDETGRTYRISLRYMHERWHRRCTLQVTRSDGLQQVRVRFGPFPSVVSTTNDLSDYQQEQAIGATFFWHHGGLDQAIQL